MTCRLIHSSSICAFHDPPHDNLFCAASFVGIHLHFLNENSEEHTTNRHILQCTYNIRVHIYTRIGIRPVISSTPTSALSYTLYIGTFHVADEFKLTSQINNRKAILQFNFTHRVAPHPPSLPICWRFRLISFCLQTPHNGTVTLSNVVAPSLLRLRLSILHSPNWVYY